MTPHWIRLKNFTGIQAGLGRDEIVIDLDKLTDGAALVAIVGPNGAGKSTLLDNLTPFRIMPSRASAYSPASFSYYDNVFGAEAAKVLEWSHDGKRYRSELLFKMGGKTKKTEAYLFEVGDERRPVVLPDGSRSDGKTDTYDRCVNAILGTPDMFFTSVFAAQNRRSLSAYTNGEIKGLLSELLDLEDVRVTGEHAGDVVKLLRGRLEGMRGELSAVEATEAEHGQTETELSGLKASSAMLVAARMEARNKVATATKKLAAVRADLGGSAEVEARRQSLQAQFNSVQQRSDAGLRQLDLDIDHERRRLHNAVESLNADIGKARAQGEGLRRQIQANEQLLARRDEIKQARTDLETARTEEVAAKQTLESVRATEFRHRELVLEVGQLKGQLQALATEGKWLGDQCQAIRVRAGLIDQVPCNGMTDLQPHCQLLKDAMTARDSLPATEASATAKRNEYTNLQERGKQVTVEIESLGDPQADLRRAEAERNRLNERIHVLAALAGEAGRLAMADEAIQTARAGLVELDQTVADKQAAIEEANSKSAATSEDLNGRRATLDREAEAERTSIQAELGSLPPPADMSAIADAEAAAGTADADRDEAEHRHDEHQAKIAGHEERLRQLVARLRDAGQTRAKAAVIETEIAHWTTLSKAMGPDGVIALAIDDAGPAIASLANDLLLSCYGPRFAVRLVTQTQTAKGDLREDFDIRVFDADRDDDKSVRDMSGGERIWINECLTRAIALFQSQASGNRYETLFADESDGALDPERKQMFVAMKRKVMELGGYQREFFISHTPELWGMADGVIDMNQFKETATC